VKLPVTMVRRLAIHPVHHPVMDFPIESKQTLAKTARRLVLQGLAAKADFRNPTLALWLWVFAPMNLEMDKPILLLLTSMEAKEVSPRP
jgi:hypothetical protein